MGSMGASNDAACLEVCDSICNAFLYNNKAYDEIKEEGVESSSFPKSRL